MNNEQNSGGTSVLDDDLPTQRSCTRCDGVQHLMGAASGMGKYRCEACEMVVGFDLHNDEPEFLIHRGMPGKYTKDVFGDLLSVHERRMTPLHEVAAVGE